MEDLAMAVSRVKRDNTILTLKCVRAYHVSWDPQRHKRCIEVLRRIPATYWDYNKTETSEDIPVLAGGHIVMRTHSSCVLFYILYQSHQIKRNSFWIKCSLTSRFTSWWATARRSPGVLLRRGTSIRRWIWLSRWGYPAIHYTHLICQSEISYLFPPSLSLPEGTCFHRVLRRVVRGLWSVRSVLQTNRSSVRLSRREVRLSALERR